MKFSDTTRDREAEIAEAMFKLLKEVLDAPRGTHGGPGTVYLGPTFRSINAVLEDYIETVGDPTEDQPW